MHIALLLFTLSDNFFSAYKYILMADNHQIMEKYKKEKKKASQFYCQAETFWCVSFQFFSLSIHI